MTEAPSPAPAARRRGRRRTVEAKAASPWIPHIGGVRLPGQWRLGRVSLRRTGEGFLVTTTPRRLRPPPPRPARRAIPKQVRAGHPEVFRWRYYLQQHPDLRDAGIRSRDQALRHWKTRGIQEGRHAHPAFSPVDYLRLHADVRQAARQSGIPPLRFAITHWLETGRDEERTGRIVAPPPPEPPPLTGLAARLTQILDGTAPVASREEAPSYLNVELPASLRRLLKKTD